MAKTAASNMDPADKDSRIETRERILRAAIEEFCDHGYSGGSTSRIVARAQCNIRMLYHYYANKDGLYRAALARVYDQLRASEDRLHFWTLPPREGIAELTRFTFDYMIDNRQFPRLIINENLNEGRVVREIESINAGSRPFIGRIDLLLEAGMREGVFTRRPAAIHLYLTILALSFVHISNLHTLTATFGIDIGSEDFLRERRDHAVEVVMAYLGCDPSVAEGGR